MTKAIVTDIEGTTSSIAFVKEVLFPYATKTLPVWLKDNRNLPTVQQQINAVAETIGRPVSDLESITKQLLTWIDEDIKAPPLKALQGMLWEAGYACGDYRAHIYEDAIQKLQDWHAAGLPLYVYSSGSVHAQQLFFQYSCYGDVRNLFSGYFDTTTGAKTDAESYRSITAAIQLDADDILFLSDTEAEIDAAFEAGLNAVLLTRPADRSGNADDDVYAMARNFHEIQVSH